MNNPYTTITPTAYNIDLLPTWKPGSTHSTAYTQEAGQGYDITAMRLHSARRAQALTRANGAVSDGAFKYPCFVTDLMIDWSLAGSIAQGHLTRDMYPHNFVQPAFMIQGISLDQQDYGELCEFVHQAQHNAIDGGKLIQLNITGIGLQGGRQRGPGVRTQSHIIGNENLPNQGMRGRHQPVIAQGYIGSMQRRHQQFVYAPTWQFAFVVATMIAGPYQEDLVQLQKQLNWIDVLKASATISSTPQAIKQSKQFLKDVQNSSANVFNTQGG